MKPCLLIAALFLASSAPLLSQAPPPAPIAPARPVPVPSSAQDASEARNALVIGVGNYSDRYFTKLQAPEADAQAMSEKLTALGFTVTLKLNATRREMMDAADAFGDTLARKQGVGLFYFSGHGSIKPDEPDPNFLIPAGTNISSREDLPQEAFNAQRVANRMKEAGNRLNLIFLDACRSNTLPSRGKDNVGGLAAMRGASGLMFFFATQPNQIALEDGDKRRSLFTDALLEHMATPGLSFMDMMADVTAATERLSTGDGGSFKQSPFMSGTLSGRFSFQPASLTTQPGVMTEAEIQRRVAAELAKRTPMPPPISNSGSPISNPPSAISHLPSPASAPKAGSTMEVSLPGGEKMTFCYCPAGSFTMGSPAGEADRSDYEAQVQVRLSKGYWMAATECTQGQWSAVMGSNPSHFTGSKDLPVEMVSWEDCQSFITKLNSSAGLPTGLKFALPTEAQWEYACRAGTESVFSFGDTLTSSQANFDGNYPYGSTRKGTFLEKTSKAGSYSANAWGLYDMHGNVWEWCQDAWDAISKLPGGTDPLGTSGSYRVDRGGGWGDYGHFCRSSYRNWYDPGERSSFQGFRPVAVPAR